MQRPGTLALVALGAAAAYMLLRSRPLAPRPGALLWVSAVWGLWAVWEFAIVRMSPEADIRVDLLLILPVVLIVTVAGVLRAFWPSS